MDLHLALHGQIEQCMGMLERGRMSKTTHSLQGCWQVWWAPWEQRMAQRTAPPRSDQKPGTHRKPQLAWKQRICLLCGVIRLLVSVSWTKQHQPTWWIRIQPRVVQKQAVAPVSPVDKCNGPLTLWKWCPVQHNKGPLRDKNVFIPNQWIGDRGMHKYRVLYTWSGQASYQTWRVFHTTPTPAERAPHCHCSSGLPWVQWRSHCPPPCQWWKTPQGAGRSLFEGAPPPLLSSSCLHPLSSCVFHPSLCGWILFFDLKLPHLVFWNLLRWSLHHILVLQMWISYLFLCLPLTVVLQRNNSSKLSTCPTDAFIPEQQWPVLSVLPTY